MARLPAALDCSREQLAGSRVEASSDLGGGSRRGQAFVLSVSTVIFVTCCLHPVLADIPPGRAESGRAPRLRSAARGTGTSVPVFIPVIFTIHFKNNKADRLFSKKENFDDRSSRSQKCS